MTTSEAGRIVRAHYPDLRYETDDNACRIFFERHPERVPYLDHPPEAFRDLLRQIHADSIVDRQD